ncbi:hypothetical protein ACNQR9_16905 [Mycolicibacterium peregrinum]
MSDIENGPDDTLSPSESTDSDEVANADGDDVVDPPEQWHGADRAGEPESLESKLDAERPDKPAVRGLRATSTRRSPSPRASGSSAPTMSLRTGEIRFLANLVKLSRAAEHSVSRPGAAV